MLRAERLQRNGQLAEAEAVLRQIVDSTPDHHPAWHMLGLIAFEVGKLPLSIELIGHAVRLNDAIPLYHRNLGELCRRLGRLDEAVTTGKRATALAPNDLEAHYNLGLALTDKGEWDAAIRSYRRALELNPDHGLSWNNLGAALEKKGDLAGAEVAYARAVALNPAHHEAQNNLGAIYSQQGRLVDACRCFEASIKANPDFIEPHFNLSSLKTYRADDPHLLHLERNLARAGDMPVPARIRYWFALGKAREDVGRYDEAFAAYAEGNRLQHDRLPCDEARADEMLARLIAIFDRDFFAARRDVRGRDKTPIFIVGMPRSGTTLLEQILASHPAVHGAGELPDLNQVIMEAPARVGRRFPDFVPDLRPEDYRRLGDAYVERVWRLAPGTRYITDKMPANFFYIGVIRLMLPKAKIIHAMRDPMDSCFSNYARLFNDTMEFAYDLGTLGRYYVRYIKLMRHWHAVLPAGSLLDLRYEDLVADPEGQTRRLLDYLGLPWDDNCLAFHRNRRQVKTASVAQVRQPIYKTSVARWRHFETHLQPLRTIVQAWRE